MTRSLTIGITAFWCLMSYLLLRSEFGDLHAVGTPIPPTLIWKRLLESSDQSLLALTHHGLTNRIGSFKWLPTTVETNLTSADNGIELPEGMTHGILGYTIDFDGNLILPDASPTNRIRLSSQIRTDAAGAWTHLHLQIALKPRIWTIEADASDTSVRVHTENAGVVDEAVYTIKDVLTSQGLLSQLGLFGEYSAMLPALMAKHNSASSSFFTVDARQDHRLRFGGQKIRCYRLRFTALGSYIIDVFVNPQSGEVIRVNFPNRVSLINETFL